MFFPSQNLSSRISKNIERDILLLYQFMHLNMIVSNWTLFKLCIYGTRCYRWDIYIYPNLIVFRLKNGALTLSFQEWCLNVLRSSLPVLPPSRRSVCLYDAGSASSSSSSEHSSSGLKRRKNNCVMFAVQRSHAVEWTSKYITNHSTALYAEDGSIVMTYSFLSSNRLLFIKKSYIQSIFQ